MSGQFQDLIEESLSLLEEFEQTIQETRRLVDAIKNDVETEEND